MYEFLQYRVRHVMTPDPVTVSPTATVHDLDRLFRDRDFNGVPVVADDGRLAGVITKYDLLRAFRFDTASLVPDYPRIMALPVSAFMRHDVVTMGPDTPLTRVLERLVDARVKSFPVLLDEVPVGIVAREDVLRALGRARDHRAPDEV